MTDSCTEAPVEVALTSGDHALAQELQLDNVRICFAGPVEDDNSGEHASMAWEPPQNHEQKRLVTWCRSMRHAQQPAQGSLAPAF